MKFRSSKMASKIRLLKIKQLEHEISTVKAENTKVSDELHAKLNELKEGLENKEEEAEQAKKDEPLLREKIIELEQQVAQLTSK